VLEFRLLGPLEVRDGERVLDVRRLKQRALLAALALRAGDVVSTERLVDELWGERAPKTAKHALENYVSELRKILGKDVILTRPSGYELHVEPDQVDVAQFERLVAEASGKDVDERAERLGRALSLFRGPPLADLVFEPFAGTEAPRLAELELAAREELVEAELELGHHTQVVAVVEPLVALHPYRERLRAQLMLALYRCGRQAEALAAYQDARRILVEELGIDPGEELQELERSILRQDPVLRPPPRIAAPPRPAPEEAAPPPRRPARKTVTVVFAELANLAALADRLDPEPLRAVLDRYLDVVRTAVDRHEGTSGRLAGDAVLAVFGVPASHEDDALRAVRAAVEMREGVGVLNDGLLPEHGVFLEVRTALNTGEVLVTPDGDELATGRAVAVAEQLERAARPGQIVLGEPTYALVKDVVEAEPLPAETAVSGGFRLVELLGDVYGRPLRLDSPMVGRRRQLVSLSSAFENAVTDRALHLFTVLGTAGVGKSRLVREFVESIEGVAMVLQGRCIPYGEGITYWPLHEALRDAGHGEAELGDDPPAGVRTLFERLSRDRPLAVVLDDLQWAEPALLDLVEQVAESSREAPILVVCIARPELLDDRPTWGGGKLNASSVLLEPLNEAESERLMDNLLGESDLAEPVRDYIVRTAAGNPLFVEELLATLVDRDVLIREAGRWTTTEVPAIPLPPTIQALIAARIDRLPDGERMVLELASIDGKKVFHRGVVAELAPEELRADVDAHLGALVRKELVRPRPPDEDSFSFRHQLIRDAAYGSMPMTSRAELHERLAGWLERTPTGAPVEVVEIVGYHRDQAQRYRTELGQAPSSNLA